MEKEYKEFDMYKDIKKPRFYLVLLVWIISLYFNVINRVKYRKTNFKSFKEPSLILCNHASMQDMASVATAIMPYSTCWVASIEEFNGREWLFRRLGVIPKRKFTSDLICIKRIAEMIRNKHKSVTMYPETRFSLAGINEDISPAIGKLVKLCKCRVIVIIQKGNFIKSPQWNKHPYRENRVYVDSTEIISKQDSIDLTEEEITKRINDAFIYDDYKWQYENKVVTNCKQRATNIHKILYKCPNCNNEGCTDSKGIFLWCNKCNSKWELSKYGELIEKGNTSKFKLPSDWYKWERQECIKEVNEGKYKYEGEVLVKKLVNAKVKFKEIGTANMIHDINGFNLQGKLFDGSDFTLIKNALSMRSVHIEYDYKGTGEIIDLATLEETYWIYPKSPCILTKFNFAQEAIFDLASKKNK